MNERRVFERALEYALVAPIVVDPRWPDVPKGLRERAIAYRLARAVECVEKEVATEFEALVYLHTASMSAPLPPEWFRVFFHLAAKYFPEAARKVGVNPIELSDYEKRLLEDLRRWIFRRQMEALRKRGRAASTKQATIVEWLEVRR